jgi:hypothetical protein
MVNHISKRIINERTYDINDRTIIQNNFLWYQLVSIYFRQDDTPHCPIDDAKNHNSNPDKTISNQNKWYKYGGSGREYERVD